MSEIDILADDVLVIIIFAIWLRHFKYFQWNIQYIIFFKNNLFKWEVILM